jgi:glucan phosphoethanolaminetransferase (alkaline phosphatase superfamily)
VSETFASSEHIPQASGGEEVKKYPKHPITVIFHILFKAAAIATYLFGSILFPTQASDIVTFIICILFLAFDFWTTKNVTGRLLVGLRWWNEVREDGSNVWIFESLEDRALLNPHEVRLFWICLILPCIIWLIFAIAAFFSLLTELQWLFLSILALVLNLANVIGYIKCARDARRKLKALAGRYVADQVISQTLGP